MSRPQDVGSVLVVIPTYNERENLGAVVRRLHAAAPQADVLIVDDNSPDGTGRLADELAAADGRITVMHRVEKAGLGAAYIAGFRWGLAREYGTFVEMDADGSHPPEQLPAMLAALRGADLVIGSRYVPGGKVVNWPKRRQILSRGGNLYSRLMLGVRIKDITAGYRAYRRSVLEKFELDDVMSTGYCFQIDLAWRTVRAGFTVVESPITFTERELGESKMHGGIVREAVTQVARWGMRRRGEQIRGVFRRKKRTD